MPITKELADVGADLERRFAHNLARALDESGTRTPQRSFALPPALLASMVETARLEGGRCPEVLAAYYADKMPAMLIDQLYRARGPAELLWRRLDARAMPRLDAALGGLFAALASAGLDPRAMLGAASQDELLAARPSAAELHAPTLFGTGMPMLGGYPAELAVMATDLAAGRSPEWVLDLRLSGNLVHELCHGLAAPSAAPVWMVTEAAALHLGHAALPAHVFPAEPAEAVPGVALFVLLGEALARHFGRAALWQVARGTAPAAVFGARVGLALAIAGWQDWLRSRQPPFANVPLAAPSWVKLVEVARAGRGPDEGDAVALALTLPDLLAAADRIPWAELPWWQEAPTAADDAMLDVALHALMQVHRMAPTFQTHPTDPPGGRVLLDVTSCTLRRERCADGVFAEPATWLVPPPLARLLHERGARTVVLEGVTRLRRADAAAALRELMHGGPLPPEVTRPT